MVVQTERTCVSGEEKHNGGEEMKEMAGKKHNPCQEQSLYIPVGLHHYHSCGRGTNYTPFRFLSMKRLPLLVAFLALFFTNSVIADEDSHVYVFGESVNLWINKIGPYHNPQETYRFDSMPLCSAAQQLSLYLLLYFSLFLI